MAQYTREELEHTLNTLLLIGKPLIFEKLELYPFYPYDVSTGEPYQTSDYTGMNLSGIIAHNALFGETRLRRVNLSGADLTGSDCSSTGLAQADLSEATLEQVNFCMAGLSRASFHEAKMRGACLMTVRAFGTDFTEADMREVDGKYADLAQADLSDANLSGADLSGADLYLANLTRANLSDCNLTGVRLHLTNLTDANLTGAIFTEADMDIVYFWNTNYTQGQFDKAEYVRIVNRQERPEKNPYEDPEAHNLEDDFTYLEINRNPYSDRDDGEIEFALELGQQDEWQFYENPGYLDAEYDENY